MSNRSQSCDPLTSSALRLARAIRDGELSSREVVDAHIARIEQVNPRLNAVVHDRFESARAEADAADRERAVRGPGDLPPLHGVPCTIKENFAVEGMPNSSGLVARKHLRATADATCVARLRRAGAIPLGVTNVSELCMWLEANNRVYGRTGNAYAPNRIAGGSSGGEGSIVGAAGSPFGLGSDVAGSIRLPAFFNGVFGHKPTGGLVPGSGQFPNARGAGLRYLTTGPLCRRAEDLMPLLRVLAGPDGVDAGCRPLPLRDPGAVSIAGLRVLDVRGNGLSRVAPELLAAQARAADWLAERGADVATARFPALRRSFEVWAGMMSEAETRGGFRQDMQRPSLPALLAQLALWSIGRSPHTFPALALGLVEDVGSLVPGAAARATNHGRALRAELLDALGESGVMLYPSFARPAPRHRWPAVNILGYSLASAYTSIFNALELPVTQVPLGLGRQGVPLGVQVVSGPGNDHLTIAVALELERGFGGWTEPRNSQEEP